MWSPSEADQIRRHKRSEGCSSHLPYPKLLQPRRVNHLLPSLSAFFYPCEPIHLHKGVVGIRIHSNHHREWCVITNTSAAGILAVGRAAYHLLQPQTTAGL